MTSQLQSADGFQSIPFHSIPFHSIPFHSMIRTFLRYFQAQNRDESVNRLNSISLQGSTIVREHDIDTELQLAREQLKSSIQLAWSQVGFMKVKLCPS